MLMLLWFVVFSEALLVHLDLLIEEASLGSRVGVGKGLNECFQQLGTDKKSLLENLSSLQGGWTGSHLKVPCNPNYSIIME